MHQVLQERSILASATRASRNQTPPVRNRLAVLYLIHALTGTALALKSVDALLHQRRRCNVLDHATPCLLKSMMRGPRARVRDQEIVPTIKSQMAASWVVRRPPTRRLSLAQHLVDFS